MARQREQDATASARQAVQRELVERARNIPGVAEAVEAYAKLERFVAVGPNQATSRVRYASGGNQ